MDTKARTVGISVAERHAQGAAHAWAKVLSLEMPHADVKYTESSSDMLKYSDVWGTRRQQSAAGTLQRPILLKRLTAASPIATQIGPQASEYPRRAAITGGLGALGTLVARSMAFSTSAPSELVLIGRSAGLDTAAGFAAASTAASNVMVTIMKLDGALSNDVHSLCEMTTLHAIHHASGVLRDAAIRAQTVANIRISAASKTDPARVFLSRTAATMPIHQHIMYGSIASSLGSAGQLPYAMANSELESVVSKSASQGIQSINVAWGAWASVGMAVNAAVETKLTAVGITVLQPEIGLSIIHGLLRRSGTLKSSSFIAAGIQWSKLLFGGNRSKMPFYQDMLVASAAEKDANQSSNVHARTAETRQQPETAPVINMEGLVMDAISKVLGRNLGLDEPLLAGGLDSIGSGEVHALLEKSARVSLPSTLVFDYPTAASIIGLLKEKIPAPREAVAAAAIASVADPRMHVLQIHQQLSLQEITDIVTRCVTKILGSDPGVDVLLMSAGLDSLGVPQLQKELASAFELIEIPTSIAIDYPTIESMAPYIARELDLKALALKEAAAVAAAAMAMAAEQDKMDVVEENTRIQSTILLAPSNTIAIASPLAPKLSKAGYFTVPSIRRLQRMSEEELSQVSRFVIGRQGYGEIAFLYPVNLCNANLDEIVHIGKGSITLYGNGKMKTPLPGSGLNQPALLTFKRIFPRSKTSKGSIMAFKGVLLQACSRMGATFVHWDPDEGVWIAKVEQF